MRRESWRLIDMALLRGNKERGADCHNLVKMSRIFL